MSAGGKDVMTPTACCRNSSLTRFMQYPGVGPIYDGTALGELGSRLSLRLCCDCDCLIQHANYILVRGVWVIVEVRYRVSRC
jgi:hypothetical protein